MSDRFIHLDILCRPPVAYSLGMLATVLYRYEADEHLQVAIDIAMRVRSPLFRALTEVEQAAMFIAGGDQERARRLIAKSLYAATRFGWGAVERRAPELLQSRA